MKKTTKFFFAALSILAVASCAKEELTESTAVGNVISSVTVGFDQTKTALQGTKTVWAAGDTLWLSNGTESKKVGVPESAIGSQSFTFENSFDGTLYIVYPYAAAQGVSEGKVTVKVESTQDGSFGNANISCGVSTKPESGSRAAVTLKNVTAVMKVNVSDTNPIEALIVSGNGVALAGPCTVDLATGTPVVTPTTTSDAIKVETAGAGGLQYVGVIPGTYPAGFSVNAVSSELSVESKATVSAKTVAANDMIDLGAIGNNLSALEGEGTEASPYLVGNFAQWLAFSVYVNAGNTMEGKYIKLTSNIEGVNNSVGYLTSEGDDVYFKGNFDGDGKTVSVNLNGSQTVALFGDATAPASFKNVTVAGTVVASGNYAAGLVAMLNGSTGVTISNCHNTASVSANAYVGGIAGYTDGIVTFDECSNAGDLASKSHWIGGIAGISSTGTYEKCSNTGNITNKGGQCTGGILGKLNGATVLNECTNSGTVTVAQMYAGGIAGYGNETPASIVKCVNNGTVTGTTVYTSITSSGKVTSYEKRCYWGGIIGMLQAKSADKTVAITECVNNGTIDAKACGGYIAGIAGFFQDASGANGGKYFVTKCVNNGTIYGLEKALPKYNNLSVSCNYAGGILGYAGHVKSIECVNKGEIIAPAQNYVAGIHATNRNAVIEDGLNEGSITGYSIVAGITSYQNWSSTYRSINKGAITGVSTQVGGIVGQNNKAGKIYSCGNDGPVTAPGFVGGVVGYMPNSTLETLWSAYNNGPVTFTSETSDAPYAGGIIGRHVGATNDWLGNLYNSGVVSCSGTAKEGAEAAIGAIAGGIGTAQDAGELYFLKGTFAKAFGNAKEEDKRNALQVEEDGTFTDGAVANVNGVECDNIKDALNAWIDWRKKTYSCYYDVVNTKAKFTTRYVVE